MVKAWRGTHMVQRQYKANSLPEESFPLDIHTQTGCADFWIGKNGDGESGTQKE